MNLAKALKLKNSLAGELNRLQHILTRENSRRSDNVSKVNRQEVWDQILATSDRLGLVKAKIAEANVPIYVNLERMAELKSRIAFLNRLETREGEEALFYGGSDPAKVVYQWDAFINREQLDGMVSMLQKQIEEMQDEVDEYNNKTHIDA